MEYKAMMQDTVPILRKDLEFIPVQHKGQQLILIRDHLGLVQEGKAVAPPLYQLMTLLDGTKTVRDLQMELMRQKGGVLVGMDEVKGLLADLDESYLLDSGGFRKSRDQIVADFASKKVRPCSHGGRSYPDSPPELKNRLDEILASRPPVPEPEPTEPPAPEADEQIEMPEPLQEEPGALEPEPPAMPEGPPVEGTVECHESLPPSSIPCELHRCLDSLSSGIAEEDFLVLSTRHDLNQLLRQIDLNGIVEVCSRHVDEACRLVLYRLDHLRMAVPRGYHSDTCGAVYVLISIHVPDLASLAFLYGGGVRSYVTGRDVLMISLNQSLRFLTRDFHSTSTFHSHVSIWAF